MGLKQFLNEKVNIKFIKASLAVLITVAFIFLLSFSVKIFNSFADPVEPIGEVLYTDTETNTDYYQNVYIVNGITKTDVTVRDISGTLNSAFAYIYGDGMLVLEGSGANYSNYDMISNYNDSITKAAISVNGFIPKTCEKLFAYDHNLVKVDLSALDLSNSNNTSMEYMFRECRELQSVKFSDSLDTSKISNMGCVFQDCSSLTSLDLSMFDTSNVTTMSGLFSGCTNLSSVNFGSKFNTGNNTNFIGTFSNTRFSTLDLSGFDMSRVLYTSQMFYGCSQLKSVTFGNNLNLSSIQEMKQMFYGCTKLESVDLSVVSTTNNLKPDSYNTDIFNGCTSLKKLNLGNFNLNKGSLNISGSALSEIILPKAISISETLPVVADAKWYGFDINDQKIDNPEYINGYTYLPISIDTDEDGTFESGELYKVKLVYDYLYLDSVTGIKYYADKGVMVSNPSNEISLTEVIDNTTSKAYLYANGMCILDGVGDIDLKLEAGDPDSITKLVTSINGYKLTLSCEAFSELKELETVDISTLDISLLDNLNEMFIKDESLISIDLSSLDTSNIIGMGEMFSGCTSLEEVIFEKEGGSNNFDTSNVIVMSNMFQNCYSIETIDISCFDSSSLLSTDYMFMDCSNLNEIIFKDDDNDTFTMSNVISANSMFSLLNADTLDLSNMDFSNLGNTQAFNDKYSLYDEEIESVYSYLLGIYFDSDNYSDIFGMSMLETISTPALLELFDRLAPGEIILPQALNTVDPIDIVIPVKDGYVYKKYDIQGNILGNTSTLIANEKGKNGNSTFDKGEAYKLVLYEDVLYQDSKTGTKYYVDKYIEGGVTKDEPIKIHIGDTTSDLVYAYLYKDGMLILDGEGNIPSQYTNTKYNFKKPANEESGGITITKAAASTNGFKPNRLDTVLRDLTSLTRVDFSNFDTSNVTSMSYMLNNCSSLTSLDLSNFDTRNVTNMSCMFNKCSSLTSLNVSNFDTSNVTDMYSMFNECNELTSITFGGDFDTSNVTSMDYMFYKCSSLTSLVVNKFNTSNVTDMSRMFGYCSSLTSLDLSNFDTRNVTDMASMFSNCSSLTSLDVSKFNTSNVTNMASMFGYCSSLTSLDASNFDTRNVTDMSNMFSNCSSLTSLDVSKFNTSNVTLMNYMFSNCNALTKVDVLSFDTHNVVNVAAMFQYCSNLTTLNISSFDTSSVSGTSESQGMYSMFGGCTNLQTLILDADKFDTSNVYSMYFMFYNCKNLKSIDTSKFDTSNCHFMHLMFKGCEKLTSLDLDSFDTSNVEDMNNMFCNCKELELLDLSTFNTSNVKNMKYLFAECNKLKNIVIDTAKFKTNNVTDMSYMFEECYLLETFDDSKTKIDFSKFNTSLVQNFSSMFSDCDLFETLDLSSFVLSSNPKTNYMFLLMDNIKKIDMRNFDLSNITSSSNLFELKNLKKLEEVVLPKGISIANIDLPTVTGKEWKGYDIKNKLIPGAIYTTLPSSNDGGNSTFESGELFKIKLKGPAQLLYDDTANNKKYYEDGYKENGVLIEDSLKATFDLSEAQDGSMMAYLYSDGTLIFDGKGYYDEDDKYHANYSVFDPDYESIERYSNARAYSIYAKDITRVRFSKNGYKPNDMTIAFYGLYNLTDIDFTNLDTSELRNVMGMFEFCTSLTSVDLSSIDFSKVEWLDNMFMGCINLENVKMGNMDPEEYLPITKMSNMFTGCTKLESLDLSGMIFGLTFGLTQDINPFATNDDSYGIHEILFGPSPYDETTVALIETIYDQLEKSNCNALKEIKLPIIEEDSKRIVLTESEYMISGEFDEGYNHYNQANNEESNAFFVLSDGPYNDGINNIVSLNGMPSMPVCSTYIQSKLDGPTYMVRDSKVYTDPVTSMDYYFDGTIGPKVIASVSCLLGSNQLILYEDGTLLLYGDGKTEDIMEALSLEEPEEIPIEELTSYALICFLAIDKLASDYDSDFDILKVVCSDGFDMCMGGSSFSGSSSYGPDANETAFSKITNVDFSNANLDNWVILTNSFRDCTNLERVDLSGVNFSKINSQDNACGFFRGIDELTVRDYLLFTSNAYGMTADEFLDRQGMTYAQLEDLFNNEILTSPEGIEMILSMQTVMPNFKEIVLPEEVPSGDIEIKLPVVPGKVFYGADRDGNIDYSKTYKKLVKQTSDVYKLVACGKLLFTDEDGVIYYTDGTSKDDESYGDDKITLDKTIQLCSSSIDDLYAYVYSNGVMVLDGEGTVSDDFYSITEYKEALQSRELTKVAFSNNGFKPNTANELLRDAYYVTDVYQFDKLDLSNCEDIGYLFWNCYRLENIHLKDEDAEIDTSNVKVMDGMFNNCLNLKDVSFIKNFTDVSNVKNICCMFEMCKSLTSVDLSTLDFSDNLIDIDNMFHGCSKLETIKFSDDIDTSQVTDMSWLFLECFALDTIEGLDKFDTSSVTDFKEMFGGCTSLTGTLDISNFTFSDAFDEDGEDIEEDLSEMFSACINLKSIIFKDGLTIPSSCKTSCMFEQCNNLTNITWNNITYNCNQEDKMYGMFDGCNSLETLDLSGFNLSNSTSSDELWMTYTNDLDSHRNDLVNSNWGYNYVLDFIEKYENGTYTVDDDEENYLSYLEYKDDIIRCELHKSAGPYKFNKIKLPATVNADETMRQALTADAPKKWVAGDNNYNVIDSITAYTNIIAQTDTIKSLVLSDGCLYTDEKTNTKYYKTGTNKTEGDDKVDLVKSWDITDTTKSPAGSLMVYLYSDGMMIFDGAGSNKQFDRTKNNSWYTTNYSDTDTTKCKSKVTKVAISNNGFKPTYLDFMFSDLENCTQIYNLDKLDTSECLSFKCAFEKNKWSSLNLSTIDTHKATDLSYMFNECTNLTSITLPAVMDTSNAKYFGYMFKGCTALTSITLPSMTTTGANTIAERMFDGCSKLTSLDVSGMDTSNISNMAYMFSNCSSLTSITLPAVMDTSNVTTIDYIFSGCRNLSEEFLSSFVDKFDTTSIASIDRAFNSTKIRIEKFNEFIQKIDLSKVSWQGLCAGIYNNAGDSSAIDLSNSNFTNTTGCIHPTTLNGFMCETYGVQNVILNDDMTIYDFSNVTDYSTCFNTYDKAGHGGSAYNDVDEENVIHKLCYDLFDFTSTQTMSQMFRHASSLRKIDLTKFKNLDTTGTILTNTGQLFQEDYDLQEVIFPENFTIGSIGQWTLYHLYHIENVNWEDVIVVNPLNVNSDYVLSNMGSDTEVSKLAPKFDFSNFKFTGDNPSGAFANDLGTKEIVMPQDTASRIPFISALVKAKNKYDYFALDSDGNTLYKINAATNSTALATRYNPTDAQKEATVRLVQGNLLFRDDYNNTPSNKNDDRLYYDCGTSDDSITLVNSWDITDTTKSQAGSLMVYLYSDGTMIFDGEGVNKQYVYSGKFASQEYRPWTNSSTGAYSLDADYGVTIRIVISDNGFKPTNLDSLFANYKGTKFYNFDKLDTSSCTSMDHAFIDNSNLEQLDVSNFVIGKENEDDKQYVTSMRNTFECGSNDLLEIKGLDKLDTSKVEDMTYMFNNASKNINFTLNLSNFDTSSAETFYGMFGNLNITSLNLSKFVTTNVTDMNNMFYGMHNITEIDMSNFDTSNVDDFKSMFNGCSSLETVKIKLNDTALTDVSNMFSGCSELKTIDLTGSKISKNLLPLSTVNSLEKVVLPETISSNISLYTKDGHFKWVEANSSFTPLTPEVTHDKLIAMSNETNGVKTLVRIDDLLYDDGDTKYYRDGTDKESITLVETYDLSSAGNHSVNAYLYSDKTFIYDGKGTNIGYDDSENLRPWLNKLESDITRIVISNNGFKPANLNSLFRDYTGTKIYQLDKLDTSNCTNMTYAFRDSINLTELNLSKFNTSNVQIMDGIFMGCEGLTSLNLSSFDTTAATTMYAMFNACSNLTSVNISSFNTSNVKSMAYMFSGCNSLTSLSVSHFDTSKVETMSTMFSGCSSLTSLVVSNFNTSACTNMYAMFNGCKNITSLDLSNFDTSKVTNTNSMFNNMNGLTSLKLKFDDTALTEATSMFSGCNILTTLDLTGSTFTNNVFDLSNATALTKIILPDSVASDTANDSSNPSLPTKTWVKFKSNGDAYNSTLYTTLPAKTESGDYLGTAIPLSQCTFSACEVEYDGTAKKPDFAGLITFNTTTLVPGTDYTVSDYANNVEAGTATCTITGKGAYTGKKENVSFTIKPKAISVNLGASDYEATLKQQKDYDSTTNADSKSLTINGVTYQEEGSDTPVTEIINISLTASYDIPDAGDRNMIYHPEVTSVTGGHANKSNYNVSFDNIDGSNNVTLNNYGKINGLEIHYTLSNFTKVYDGNSDITLTITLDDPSGILEGQTIGNEGTDVIIPSTVHGTFDSKNVGSDKSITVDTINLTGDKSGNYYLVPKENVKGSITKKLLTYQLGSLDKTFDGTNTNNNVTVTNLTGIESIDEGKVTISSPITATFSSSNVGTYSSSDATNNVSLSEITLSGTESGDESGNYKIEQPTSYSGTISALGLTSDMFKAISDMTYTGSEIKPSLEVSDDYISKLNLTNDIEVTYSDNIDKGEATVTISPKDGGNFENSANVTLHFEILAKDIEVNLADEKYSTLLHQEKTYDGTDAGKDDLSIQADGVTGETLVITLTSTYEDKNVGTKDMKYVPTFSSVTGGRCKTSNYNVTYTNINDGVVTLNDYGTITQKLLTYTLGSLDKEYDGTNTNSNVEVTNLEGIETIDEGKVKISSPITATFISSNVGTYYSEDHASYVPDPSNKVSLSEITLSGTASGDESGNYKIEQPTSYSGKITSMMLSESMFNSISNETYNGLAHTPSITVSDSYTDKLDLDRDVTISYNNNINASVGTNYATVTIKAKDTGNFNGSSDVILHFTIVPCEVEIDLGDNSYKSALEQTKEYDGTTVAKYDMSVTTNGCNGDKLITTFTNATYDSKNVGTRKIIYTPTFSSVQGDRPYTSNYIVTYKNAESGDVTLEGYGTITQKEISYTTKTTKVYDGNNTSSTVITLNESDIISSDIGKVSVVTPVAGTYVNELVGDNKVVTPTNSVLTLEGEESGNYKVNDLSNLTGSITLPGSDRLIVDAIGNVTYKGSSLTPALTIKYDVDGDGTGDILLKSGDDYDAIYSNNINAGTANVSITYKGNYTGTDSKTFTIDPRPVTINLNSFVERFSLTQEKIYDATVNPDADDNAKFITYTDPGVTTSEVLRFDLAGVYDSKNVGTRDIIYTVTFTSVTSPNGLTSNYDITYSNGVTTDGITKVTLAGAGKIKVKDITRSDYDLTIKTKAYDGNATTTIENFSLHEGVIFSGDNVIVDDYSSCVVTLSDSKEGTHSISSISPVPTISGTDSDNYNLIFTYADDKGTIAKDVLLSEMFETISDVIYNGTAYEIVPTITSSYASKLTSDDYTLSWSNNTDASTTDNKAKVIITAKDGGNYSGSVTLEFTIKQKDITVDLNDNTTYTGSVTQEKVYNAKLNADSKSITTSGVNSEVINIPLKGSYTTKVAGETKEINYVVDESIGMTVTGGQGKISNYNVIINNLTGNYGKITEKPVTYTLVINDKVFDGNDKTTIKSLTINNGVIESNESSVLDDLSFSDYSSTVVTLASSANGTHLVTGISPVPELLGDDKDNYSLDFKWDGITGTITNKVIPDDGDGLTISNTLNEDNEVMYTGLEIPIESLGITISDSVKTLTLGTDYELSYTSSDGLSTTDATNVGENKKVYINGIGDYAGETYTTFTIIPKDITYNDLIMSDTLKTDNTKDLTKYANGKQNRFIHYGTDELEIYYLHDINGTTTDTSDDYRINFNYSDAYISDSSKAIIPFGDLESSKSLKNIVVNNLSPALAESNYRFIVSAPNEYMFTNKGYLVDNTAPTIVSLVTDNTMYGKDQTITFTMTLSEEIKPISDTSDVYLKLDIDDVYNEDNDPPNNKVATLINVGYDADNSLANILSGDNITKTVLTFKYLIDITEQVHTYHIDPKLEIVNEFVTDISGNLLDTSIPSSYNNGIEIDTNGFSIDISHDKTLIDNIFTKDDQIVYTIKINTPNNVATSDSDVKNAIKIYIGDSNYENYVDKSSDYIDKIVKVNDKEYKVTIDTTTLIEEDDTLGKSIKVKVDSETITDNLGNKNSARENVLKVIRTLEPTLTITYDGKELTRTSDGKMIDSNGNEVLIFNNDKVTITSLVTNAIIKYKDMLNTSSYVDTSSNTLVPKNILEFIVTKTNYEITSIYEFLSTWAKSPEEGNLIFRVKTLSDLVDETNKNISDNKLNDLSNELLNEKNILLLDESDTSSDLTTDEKSMLNDASHALDISKELARRVKDDDLVNSDSDPSDNKNTIDETNIEKEIKDIIKGLKDRDEFLDDIDPVDISSLDEEDIETLMINYTFQEGWVRTLLDDYPKVIELKEAYNTLIGDNETVSLVSDDDEVTIYGVVNRSSKESIDDLLKLIVRPIVDNPEFDTIKSDLESYLVNPNEKVLQPYDIKLVNITKGNALVQPKEGTSMLVTIELPKEYTNRIIHVYHEHDPISDNNIKVTKYKDKCYVEFYTDSFSNFTLTTDENINSVIISKENEIGGNINPDSKVIINDLVNRGINELQFTISLNKDYKAEIYRDGTKVKELTSSGIYTLDKLDEINANVFIKAKFIKVEPKKDDDDKPKKDITTQTITVQVANHIPYINGYGDKTFKPNKDMTRAEFSKVISTISNNFSTYTFDKSNVEGYKDVKDNAWYSKYVGYMTKTHLMSGYPDGTFKPNDPITRAEVCKVLSSMFNMPVKDIENIFYNELNGHWYFNSTNKMIKAGYVNGYPDGTFKPNKDVTRAEAVSLINRVKDRAVNKDKNISSTYKNTLNNKYKDVKESNWFYNDLLEASVAHSSFDLH